MMLRRSGTRGGDPPAAAGGDDPDPADPVPIPGAPAGVVVDVSDEQDDVGLDADALGRLAAAVLHAEGVRGPAELTLTFVAEAAMATLNAEHMGEDGPTDVLAFPLDEPDDDRPEGMPSLLGDVVVCPAVARRYATGNGRSTEHELALLVVHGVLHVLGHDHAEDDEARRMHGHEVRHLRAFVDEGFVR